MWEWYSAAIFWKSQGPWPALRGAFYDWYLAPTGGFYGTRAALANPVGNGADAASASAQRIHAQLNLKNYTLSVVAGASAAATPLCVVAHAFTLAGCDSGKRVFSRSWPVTVAGDGFVDVTDSALPWRGSSTSDVLLYRIEAWKNEATAGDSSDSAKSCEQFEGGAAATLSSVSSSQRLSIADYWLSDWTSDSAPQNYSALGAWRDDTSQHVALNASVEVCGSGVRDLASASACQQAGCGSGEYLLQVTNPGLSAESVHAGCSKEPVAFGVVAELHRQSSSATTSRASSDEDTRVLPAFYSDGLFSVLTGDTRRLCIGVGPGANVGSSDSLEVHVSGWNVQDIVLAVPVSAAAGGVAES